MKLQRYIIKAIFKTANGLDVEIIPVFETSKEEIIRKINENIKIYPVSFELYNFTWSTSDIIEYGLPDILTISEFWGDDGYV